MVAEVQAETKKRNSLNPSLATQLEQKGDSAAAAILEKYGGASSASMHPLRLLFYPPPPLPPTEVKVGSA
jgi:hypothetical protein